MGAIFPAQTYAFIMNDQREDLSTPNILPHQLNNIILLSLSSALDMKIIFKKKLIVLKI